jgi:uncharacterized membrane protein HdeD (DUF308 family)
MSKGAAVEPGVSIAISEVSRQNIERWWKVLVVAGGLASVLGVVAMIVPSVTAITMSVFMGCLLLVGSTSVLASVLQERGLLPIAAWVLIAAVWAGAGAWVLAVPLAGAVSLTVVIIAWLLADGVLRALVAAVHTDLSGPFWVGFGGVLSVALGFLIWLDFPSSAVWALGFVAGVNLVYLGLNLTVLGLAGRQLAAAQAPKLAPGPA